ncbi:GNAT family N-acetyltransferase [Streptomyces sp. PT12]|uniref:GNAT family N-acetyltransferase n=1 Tax=Streptomyces sp. PT12 TaxID=1510197 RepID=UPI00215B7D09|nr:GNAT family N-acetyltransferase [Streptomyces sp. PT12]
MDVTIRPARPGEEAALGALMLRSKGHWGYDAAHLAACRDELSLAPDALAARRVVVAEDAHEVLGVASLEGEPPEGLLGLLFVEPWAIGRGIGSALYAHVTTRARELGFTLLRVEADPHAAGFYGRCGARLRGPGRDGLVLFEAALVPRPGWLDAWTGGRRAVHVGNVADFQGQFGPLPPAARKGAGHYSGLAAFAGPHPAALVLPRAVPDGWIDLVGRQLGWGAVEVFDGLDGARGPAGAVLERPALAAHLRGLGAPLLPWGRTEAFAELAGEPWRPGGLRNESKRAAHKLFTRLAGGHPGIAVPAQWAAATRREAARLLRARARSRLPSMVKSGHGAGGSGVRLVAPGDRGRAVLRGLPKGPLLIEEYVAGAGDGPWDLTYDGVVAASGEVFDVGVAEMDVRGLAYRGATVGPGVVPAQLAERALRFGNAVGAALADDGYRGWFDVDFVTAPGGRLAPTEANLRLTGPAVAFMVKARLDELHGGGFVVRAVDRLELGARLPDGELIDWLGTLTARCRAMDAVCVPSIATAAFEPGPWLGVVLAARSKDRLLRAESLVRTAARELTRRLAPLGRSGR